MPPSVPLSIPATLLKTTAALPPPAWQLVTFWANVLVPRWIRQTALLAPVQVLVPRPQFTSEPEPVPLNEPSSTEASNPEPFTSTTTLKPVPSGTVDSTATPGATSSTSALRCEKVASVLFSATAPIEITLS